MRYLPLLLTLVFIDPTESAGGCNTANEFMRPVLKLGTPRVIMSEESSQMMFTPPILVSQGSFLRD